MVCIPQDTTNIHTLFLPFSPHYSEVWFVSDRQGELLATGTKLSVLIIARYGLYQYMAGEYAKPFVIFQSSL